MFFMMLFSVILLNQLVQNILVFNILTDIISLLLVYLQFYSSMSDKLNFYFKQHKHLLKFLLDSCFLTCSILKVTCNININDFDLYFKIFTLLTDYILLCLTNKLFVDIGYKHLLCGKYLNKSGVALSVLVHFRLFTTYLTYLSVRMLPSAMLKFANFVVLLFFTNLISRIFITLLFLTNIYTIPFHNDFWQVRIL